MTDEEMAMGMLDKHTEKGFSKIYVDCTFSDRAKALQYEKLQIAKGLKTYRRETHGGLHIVTCSGK